MTTIKTTLNDDVLEVDDTELAQLTAQGLVAEIIGEQPSATPPARTDQAAPAAAIQGGTS